jgi:hypothetical protein
MSNQKLAKTSQSQRKINRLLLKTQALRILQEREIKVLQS